MAMTAREIVAYLRNHGVNPWLVLDDKLEFKTSNPRPANADSLIQRAVANRAAIVSYLREEKSQPPTGYACGLCRPEIIPKSDYLSRSEVRYRWCPSHCGAPFYKEK